jgi:hypothetical protein
VSANAVKNDGTPTHSVGLDDEITCGQAVINRQGFPRVRIGLSPIVQIFRFCHIAPLMVVGMEPKSNFLPICLILSITVIATGLLLMFLRHHPR